jgi:hypothetical protein
MRGLLAAILVLAAMSAPAFAQCAGDDDMCWMRREQERTGDQARATMRYHMEQAQQGPGLLNWMFEKPRVDEEKAARVRLLEEQRRLIEAQRKAIERQ